MSDEATVQSVQSPYRGILPFRFADQSYFFGRESEVTDLTAKILLYRVVLLFGESGSGKSSMLNAGVFPALQREGFQPERLRVRPIKEEPMLVERIRTGAETNQYLPSIFAHPEAEAPRELSLSLADFHAAIEKGRVAAHPVLVFDQFEELFTLFEPSHRELQSLILDSIYELIARPDSGTKVVIGIREDFVGKLEILARQYAQIYDRRVHLGLMKRDAALNAITGPFQKEGHPFACVFTPKLAEAIVDGLLATEESGGIYTTQLQVVCSRLWDEYSGHFKEISVQQFGDLGSVKGILEGFLEAEMRKLSPAKRDMAYAIMGHLITASGTRDVVGEARLVDLLKEHGQLDTKAFAESVSYLEEHRLINRASQRKTYYYEVASEYLIAPIQKHNQMQQRVRELERRMVDPSTHEEEGLREGIALCLSGGGYRALLFHLGALWRLNELAYLPRLDRIAGVSCGALMAAWLGYQWKDLKFEADGIAQNFQPAIVDPLLRLASKTLDIKALIFNAVRLNHGQGQFARDLRSDLFGNATLKDLPDKPFILMEAANLQSGALWRFSKRYMADYRIGLIRNPAVDIATAVAACCSLPPYFKVVLPLALSMFDPEIPGELKEERYTTMAPLIDGYLFDPLAIESAWKSYTTLLISDGTLGLRAWERPSLGFLGILLRSVELMGTQVQSVLRRQVIDLFKLGARKGAYWGLRTNIHDYNITDALSVAEETKQELNNIMARLQALNPVQQKKLINFGYAVCDAAIRRHMESLSVPPRWPYPDVKM